ncbi:CORE-2/I-BRANCHING BETA-16-N-ACETYLGLUCOSAMINYLTRANSFERASE FAMILY PROTEIN-RELATED [Salix koriyanagi]|uniref:CORE-2/I-BRANCHING BETA-16-N-ACETYLGLUCOSAMINYLTRANSFERASE FAMILY PROTEIN-RELATED n=1 Tax=Salix koriyanagi TaxID=2511006 RepID=A0A9Q0X3W4_9ROSI|nr:CORE-2/I-BRANCHING BETA-16-N-ACETYLGLUCOSAMINYLTRANSFERASE FAMILY PROTEIN-RELATED [Salix koriyanagi]
MPHQQEHPKPQRNIISLMVETSSTNSIKIGTKMFSTQFVVIFSLFLSLPILFLLAPRIFPSHNPSIPISPSDEREDFVLFRKAIASASASATHYPSAHSHLTSKSKKLKIAFLFLTNTDLFFAPLWEQFFKSADKNLFNIYVHADPHSNVTKPSGIFFSHFIPDAKRTYRASPTLISATRRLLANAILDDPTNTYFAVLSQYCIPSPFFQIRLQFANQF